VPASASDSNCKGLPSGQAAELNEPRLTKKVDVYFSADVEADGPIPGPYSMLSFAFVVAGTFDGCTFRRALVDSPSFYAELRPISEDFEPEAMAVNGLDRTRLLREGRDPASVMLEATSWIKENANGGTPILVAYPLSFDWTWLYWYFVRFANKRSPFGHSRCFDLKTALAVKGRRTVSMSGHNQVPAELLGTTKHTHNALDDAREQAEIFANLFEWEGHRA
jgi:DNA polymerase III epsilon subunit-like protein